jgi:hypothetical protein
MMRNINYKKFHRQYLIVDIVVGILSVIIFLFTFIKDQKILFSKRLVRDIKRNWESLPIVDLITIPPQANCPPLYEQLFNETFLGTNKGCYCESNNGTESLIYEGDCVASRGDKEKCKTIEEIHPQRLRYWRGVNICVKRLNYSMTLNNNATFFIKKLGLLNLNDSSCPNNTRQCGRLDNLGNSLCVDANSDCPINDIKIGKNLSSVITLADYKSLSLSNGYSLYFSNKKVNSSIYINFDVSEGGVCIDPTEHNYRSKIYPLFKDQDPYDCDNKINGTVFDIRYTMKDKYNTNEFFLENNNLLGKLKSLPKWEEEYYNKSTEIELYSRPFISWKKECNTEENHPKIIYWINQNLTDIVDLQNELFYFHVIVLLSYFLVNIIVKWRLIKERVEFIYVVLLEALYVTLCLIEIAISIVGINKFSRFYTLNFNLKQYNCGEYTTNLAFHYLGDVFYDYSLHLYIITFIAVLSCFFYPLNSMYIYIHTSKVEAKELQNLVAE